MFTPDKSNKEFFLKEEEKTAEYDVRRENTKTC